MMCVNGARVKVPVGLFSIYAKVPFASPTLTFAIDGLKYPFERFLERYVYRSTACPRTQTYSAENMISTEVLCHINFAERMGFENEAINSVRSAVRNLFSECAEVITYICKGHTHPLHERMKFEGMFAQHFPGETTSLCVRMKCVPACVGVKVCEHFGDEFREMVASKFIRDNPHAFKVEGFGQECAGVIRALLPGINVDFLHVFERGLGILELIKFKKLSIG